VENPQHFVFNEDPALLQQARTVICTGMGRSGTSAVMSLLKFLGVWVGAERDSRNLENKELRRAIAADEAAAQEIISGYNQRFEIWGFKTPGVRKTLAETLRLFRNPILIIPHRDVVGKLGRHAASENRKVVLRDIQRLIVAQRRMVNQLEQINAPQLHIGFPLLVGFPEAALKAIADFVGLPIPEGDLLGHMRDDRNRYLAPGKSRANRHPRTQPRDGSSEVEHG
jgi:hypothetical protein